MEEDVPAVRRRQWAVFVARRVGELGEPRAVRVHRVEVGVAVPVAREDHGSAWRRGRAVGRGRRRTNPCPWRDGREDEEADDEESAPHRELPTTRLTLLPLARTAPAL